MLTSLAMFRHFNFLSSSGSGIASYWRPKRDGTKLTQAGVNRLYTVSHWKDQSGSGTGVRGGSKIYIACDKLEAFLTITE